MTPTDCKIGDTGAASLSDALKTNTTLKKLDLNGEEKKRNDTQMGPLNNPLFPILTQSKVNDIGDTGATSLSEVLKSNTALTELNLRSEHKRNNTLISYINKILFSNSHQINR